MIIGINILSCKKNSITDYKTNLNFVFVNNTKYSISFNDKANVLNIAPSSNSSYTISTEGPKELSKNDFRISPVQPLCNKCIVFYDNLKCDTLKGMGIENINNYEFLMTKIGEYELKYTFNESDFLKAKICK
jgi:hypothetical protein